MCLRGQFDETGCFDMFRGRSEWRIIVTNHAAIPAIKQNNRPHTALDNRGGSCRFASTTSKCNAMTSSTCMQASHNACRRRIGVRFVAPLGHQPVFAVRKIHRAVGQATGDPEKAGKQQRKREPECRHERKITAATHPTVRLAMEIEVRGHARVSPRHSASGMPGMPHTAARARSADCVPVACDQYTKTATNGGAGHEAIESREKRRRGSKKEKSSIGGAGALAPERIFSHNDALRNEVFGIPRRGAQTSSYEGLRNSEFRVRFRQVGRSCRAEARSRASAVEDARLVGQLSRSDDGPWNIQPSAADAGRAVVGRRWRSGPAWRGRDAREGRRSRGRRYGAALDTRAL